jgi:NitT/TauT family transport system substrate-binding protein
MRLTTFLAVIACAFCANGPPALAADAIKIGLVKSTSPSVVYLTQDKGYFSAEGITAELVWFDSSQPISVAVTSGAIDFGVTPFTAGFYSLAGQGALKIIAGMLREAPGFHGAAYIVSNRAYDAGFKSLRDMPGHSVAVTQIGSPPHYALGLLIEKFGFDPASIRILPLQSIANATTAVVGGQADATILTAELLPVVDRGDAKLLGWVGDETPWERGAAFTATATASNRRDLVERFLRAYRQGARAYNDAFIGADEKPKLGPTAPEALAIIAKYTGLDTAVIKVGLPYVDRDERLDVKDILHQIAWYKSQGLLKGDIDGEPIIDRRYVIPLPGH